MKAQQQQEKPILFNQSMVKAIMNGNKTQTRRVMKPQPFGTICKSPASPHGILFSSDVYGDQEVQCPYGVKGNRLWVKEAFYAYGFWYKNGKTKTGKVKWNFKDCTERYKDNQYMYMDNPPDFVYTERIEKKIGWYKRNSLFMPRVASRLLLEIDSLAIQHVQQISEIDSNLEGISEFIVGGKSIGFGVEDWLNDDSFQMRSSAVDAFHALWDSINGNPLPGQPNYSWSENPYVWVIEFKLLR